MSPALRTQWQRPDVDDLVDNERESLPSGDFFIYPANLWPHKNHRRVLRAFELFLKKLGRPVELILTGHPEGWDELSKEFPGLPVRHLGFVRRGFLQLLLARSRALVFFSQFEGFGMPLLEAFAAGTPVICSDVASLPEVGGDAVLACDPTDPRAMCELMERVHADDATRQLLVTRGRARLERFSWDASASELVAACERLRERLPAPAEAPSLPIDRLNQFLDDLQTDRAERLTLIRRLDSTLLESQVDRIACHAEIKRLNEEKLRRLIRALPKVFRRSFAHLFRRAG